MRTLFTTSLLAGLALASISSAPAAEPTHRHHAGHLMSPYAGQEDRAIKTFSDQDIDDLENGRGWELAKAAELNGVPGPAHLLEMKTEIGLSPEQEVEIRTLFETMKSQAIPLGKRLVALERELNQAFAKREIDADRLRALLAEIATVQSELRYVHLATHLGTPDVLAPAQIAAYNRLRGYDTGSEHPHGRHGTQ